MAEQQSYDVSVGEAKEILADRERGWEGFTQFLTYAILATVIVLLALLLFVA
ncbi:hypothetical protein [Roseicella aquatilis]|uniref:hypothetical protein n=1 Tax=Roseicella aquatilis TaxID=2527868 RepID=UPI00140529DD|nr:hypothetical protein [Roseicella aquatilis]